IKAARGRLSGAALTIFGWPEIWNGPNAPHKPTAGFVDGARNEQEVRYKIISAMVRDFPERVGIAYTPDDFRRLHGEGKFAIFISMLNA
ncbi:membrane dipeptidase, partial [Mesorhizobium sp. CU3]